MRAAYNTRRDDSPFLAQVLSLGAAAGRRCVPLCAVLVMAQGQRRAARRPAAPATPFQAATRAFIEGRYAEVDTLTDEARPEGSQRRRAARARGDRARACTRTPKPRCRRRRRVRRRARRRSSSGSCSRCSAVPGRTTTLSRVAALADTSRNAARARARRPARCRRSVEYQEANAGVPRRGGGWRRTNAAIETAWGDLFLEKYNKAEAVKSYQAAPGDSIRAGRRRSSAAPARSRTTTRRRPPSLVKRALEINPSSVDAHVFLANQAIDAEHRAEARELLNKALAINPSSLDVHSTLAALAVRRGQDPGVRGRGGQGAGHLAEPRRGVPHRRRAGRAQLPVRGSRGADAQGARARRPNDPRALADLGAQLLRTGDEAEARTALEASFKIDPYDVVTFNALQPARLARQVRHRSATAI